jgi:ribonuclease P protein component
MFRVYAKPNGVAGARLGIVTSKRVSRRAVERNYCRRLAREVFRAEGKALGGLDFVVRPLTSVTPQKSVAARAELRGLLHRALRQCRGRSETLR